MSKETKKEFVYILIKILAFALICILTFSCILSFDRIAGNIMFPAIKDGDLVIGYRLDRKYDRNDVVVYAMDGERSIGRIVGLPGDVININQSGNLIVNGTNAGLDDLYPTYAGEELEYPYRVPEDSVFILGDYRTRCQDSRHFGAVKISTIKAKAITVLRRRDL